MAIHIALKETGQEFDTEFVDLSTKVTGSGLDYLKINPKRAVPALGLENGKVITEVTTILTYLADLVPEKNLIPKSSSFERYEMMSLLSFISMDIHKNFSAFSTKKRLILGLKYPNISYQEVLILLKINFSQISI